MQQYLQLFLSGVQKKNKHQVKSFVAAFTSSTAEEGVSYTAQSFGVSLAKRTGGRTLIADVRRLSRLNMLHYSRISKYCLQTDVPNLWTLPYEDDDNDEVFSGGEQLQKYGIKSELQLTLGNLQTLRFAFDYVLLDCPALSVSDEAVLLASKIDGVIVVVEADRTRRRQIQNAKQAIEAADGNLLGMVLNKRRYTVPGWIYNRL